LNVADCPYCNPKSENVLWRGDRCRIILAAEPGFAGWCRVIWNAHVRELSELGDTDRDHLMSAVAIVERTLIRLLEPHKMNLAAMGTGAPHLHFHVIPRFVDDPTFPEPVWTTRVRQTSRATPQGFETQLGDALNAALGPPRSAS
jgi:diadenosine tetraphosphate (Ap4A) HIT family hydrolase